MEIRTTLNYIFIYNYILHYIFITTEVPEVILSWTKWRDKKVSNHWFRWITSWQYQGTPFWSTWLRFVNNFCYSLLKKCEMSQGEY